MKPEKEKKESIFRSRNFSLVFWGAVVSELGAMIYNFTVSFYILQISNNSAFLQGLYLALCGIAMLAATPVAVCWVTASTKQRSCTCATMSAAAPSFWVPR